MNDISNPTTDVEISDPLEVPFSQLKLGHISEGQTVVANLTNLAALKPEKEAIEDKEAEIADLDARLIEFAPEEETKGERSISPKQ